MRLFLACLFAGAEVTAHAAPLQVVTLSTVLTEIATTVGGDEVAVTALVRPGVDPHTFEPSPADMRVLAATDLILGTGLGLEPYLERLTANAQARGQVAELADDLAAPAAPGARLGRREPDPHWWNSVTATITIARRVAAEFSGLRPAARAAFARRADQKIAELGRLDRWVREQVAALPPGRRQLVTTHDAFGWFARDYGFSVHSISGLSPEAEPNARDLAELVDLIRREHIPAIFVESTANPGLVAAVIEETGVRLGGELLADGLAPSGDGATYTGMMRHNVLTIVGALR